MCGMKLFKITYIEFNLRPVPLGVKYMVWGSVINKNYAIFVQLLLRSKNKAINIQIVSKDDP